MTRQQQADRLLIVWQANRGLPCDQRDRAIDDAIRAAANSNIDPADAVYQAQLRAVTAVMAGCA